MFNDESAPTMPESGLSAEPTPQDQEPVPVSAPAPEPEQPEQPLEATEKNQNEVA